MSIAIASHQRREPLIRLLRELGEQMAGSTELSVGVEIIVVLDGSTDGSREAVESLELPVPVICHWQPNRGLAAARNAALAASRGEIIWFLDDDLAPGPGLVAHHRLEHEAGPAHLLLGPCQPDPSSDAGEAWLDWWAWQFAELTRLGTVDRFDRFTVANLSGPVGVFRAAGGFDESFRDYGMEDCELGYRILSAGTTVRFDPAAIAWHLHLDGERTEIRRERTVARNTVLFARRHPDTLEVLFPAKHQDRATRMLATTRMHSPRALLVVCKLATWLGLDVQLAPRRLRRFSRSMAHTASYAAGIAETAPELLPAVLTGRVDHLPRVLAD